MAEELSNVLTVDKSHPGCASENAAGNFAIKDLFRSFTVRCFTSHGNIAPLAGPFDFNPITDRLVI